MSKEDFYSVANDLDRGSFDLFDTVRGRWQARRLFYEGQKKMNDLRCEYYESLCRAVNRVIRKEEENAPTSNSEVEKKYYQTLIDFSEALRKASASEEDFQKF